MFYSNLKRDEPLEADAKITTSPSYYDLVWLSNNLQGEGGKAKVGGGRLLPLWTIDNASYLFCQQEDEKALNACSPSVAIFHLEMLSFYAYPCLGWMK